MTPYQQQQQQYKQRQPVGKRVWALVGRSATEALSMAPRSSGSAHECYQGAGQLQRQEKEQSRC